MAETFRRAFDLKPALTKQIREHLRELNKFRDWAVHPPAHQKEPILRPDICRGVEWRFMAFRCHNAIVLTRVAIMIVHRLSKERDDESALGKYCRALYPVVDHLAGVWIEEFPEHPVTTAQFEEWAK